MTQNQTTPPVSIYAISSGKGGVGKTNVVLNLSIALADMGRRVIIVDADLGLGNLDVLLGISPTFSLADVLLKRCGLKEALIEGPQGIKIIPADSGTEAFTRLNTGDMIYTLSLFQQLQDEADTILIDTASGISSNVQFFSSFAQKVILIVTPEPTSITDAYATIKVLSRKNGEKDFGLMINKVDSEQQGLEVYETLCNAAEHFLKISPVYMGFICKDPNLKQAVCKQQPLMILNPGSAACKNFRLLAKTLELEREGLQENTDEFENGLSQAFWSQHSLG